MRALVLGRFLAGRALDDIQTKRMPPYYSRTPDCTHENTWFWGSFHVSLVKALACRKSANVDPKRNGLLRCKCGVEQSGSSLGS